MPPDRVIREAEGPYVIPPDVAPALPHIRYEIEAAIGHFHAYYVDLNDCRAAFEAFLLHVRNLDEFFKKGIGKDDVRADEFLPSDRRPFRSRRVVPKKIGIRLNNELAHITRLRVLLPRTGNARKDWPPHIFLALFEACGDFAEHIASCDCRSLPSTESAHEWRAVADRIRKSQAAIQMFEARAEDRECK